MSKHKKTSTQVLVDKKVVNLQEVLLKRATGFKIKETVQDYAIVDDELKLIKKKVSVKYYPPDLSAIELILKTQKDLYDFQNYTDEELEQEKKKLIKQLKLFSSAEKEVKKQSQQKVVIENTGETKTKDIVDFDIKKTTKNISKKSNENK